MAFQKLGFLSREGQDMGQVLVQCLSSISCVLSTVLGTEDIEIIHVFTLARKVDMKAISQYQGVTYVQRVW